MSWSSMREAEVRRNRRIGPTGSVDPGSLPEMPDADGFESAQVEFDLVRRIYAATAGKARWQEFTDAMSEALGGVGVLMSLNHPSELRIEQWLASGSTREQARSRGDELLAAISRSAESMQRARSGFVSVVAESTAPNLVHLTAVGRGGANAAVIAFRELGDEDFSSEQRALVGRLAPHLNRSYQILRDVLEASQQNTALAEVMDRLPAGILLLDERSMVVFRNRAALRMFERCDGFDVVDGTMTAADSASNEKLQRMIGEVVGLSAEPGSGGILVVQRPSGGAAYPVSVSRLLPGGAQSDVVACVLISDPDSGVEPAVELLRNLHDLTPAESDLVGQLARGYTLEDAARARGVSINTMRSHLKRVFRKTGTSRQGELVQLVLRSFVPMAGE